MNKFNPDHIRTFTGIQINVFDPRPDLICIEDIAHALSMQCRFGGHIGKYYSVAEHCTNTAKISHPAHKFAALMHDASEAYLLDIPTPVKRQLPGYKEAEDRLMKMIAEKFGFEYPLHENIKAADAVMLDQEWNGLVINPGSVVFKHYLPMYAEANFMYYFNKLKTK